MTSRSIGVMTACAIAMVLAPGRVEAQVKPFKIRGHGVAPIGIPLPGQEPRPHWIVGHATGLGEHLGMGAVRTDTANFEANGRISGEFGSAVPFVFVGENGQRLVCNYGRDDLDAEEPGMFQLIPVPERGPGIYRAFWIAEFVPIPRACTGKFAGVTGSWIMYAKSEPFNPFGPSGTGSYAPVPYSWEGEGSLTFPKKKH